MSSTLGLWPALSWEVDLPSVTLSVTVNGVTEPITVGPGQFRGLAPTGAGLLAELGSVLAGHPEISSVAAPVYSEGAHGLRATIAVASGGNAVVVAANAALPRFGLPPQGFSFNTLSAPDLVIEAPWDGLWCVRATTSVAFDRRILRTRTASPYQQRAFTQVSRGEYELSTDEHLLVPGARVDPRMAALESYAVQSGTPTWAVYGTFSGVLQALRSAPREARPGGASEWLWRHVSLTDLAGTVIDLEVPGDLSTESLAPREGGGRRHRVSYPWVAL